jgi:hypothetical protein
MPFGQNFQLAHSQLAAIKHTAASSALERLQIEGRALDRAENQVGHCNQEDFRIVETLTRRRAEIEQDRDGSSHIALQRSKLPTFERNAIEYEIKELLAQREENALLRERHLYASTALRKRIGACLKLLAGARLERGSLKFAPIGKAPTAGSKASVRGEIVALQEKLERISTERQQLEAAPITADEAKQIVRRSFDRLARRPSVARIVEGTESEIYLPPALSRENGPDLPDAVGLLCWAFKDQLLPQLLALVDEDADPSRAVSQADREKKLAKLTAERLSIERSQEALTFAGLKLGMNIGQGDGELPLRGDADPRAILGLDDQPVGDPGSAD